MNKLKTLTGGHKASLRDYDHIQGAFADIFKGLGEMFFGLDMQKVIVSGIEFTINGTEYSHTAGVVFYNGEFFEVDALEAPLDSPGGKPKFAVTTGYPTDFPTIRFADGDDKSVHEIRKVALFPSTYAEGEDYDTFVGPDFWSAIQNENRRFVTDDHLQQIENSTNQFSEVQEIQFASRFSNSTLRVQKVGSFFIVQTYFSMKDEWWSNNGEPKVSVITQLPVGYRPSVSISTTYLTRDFSNDPGHIISIRFNQSGDVVIVTDTNSVPNDSQVVTFSSIIY